MSRQLTYRITKQDADKTVYAFLKENGFSRHLLTQIKKEPSCLVVNGSAVFSNYRLSDGESLFVTLPTESSNENIIPVNLPFEILYEDEDLLVINKPADMPCHPSMGNYTNTLANGIAWYFAKKNEPFVYRCINRLDRDTTGLLILAKNALSASILSSMVKSKDIQREYLAITTGTLEPLHGTVNAPIARTADSVIERSVDFEQGETAVTHYKTLLTGHGLSLVHLKLETGRTHQIRVHMKYLGHPLIGDFLYHPDMRNIKRQALHSYRLSFCHPISKEPLTFTAPLPDDMLSALSITHKDYTSLLTNPS